MATITGTGGNDTIRPGSISAGVSGVGPTDLLAGDDSIAGLDGLDSILGGAGNDTILGGVGDDTLGGGDGLDTLQGGDGDDRADFLATGVGVGESFDGGAGFDTANFRDDAITDITGLALTGVEQLIFSVFATTTLTLAQFNQATTLTSLGTPFSLRAAGPGAWDLSGKTILNLGTFFGSAGNDTITGRAVTDILVGEAGNDRLVGGDGNDSLSGGAGNDTAVGGIGDDTLAGGDGLDTLQGGNGDDRVDFLATGIGAGESFDGGTGFDTANFRDDTIPDITALALTGVEQLIFSVFATTTLTLSQFNQATTLTSLGTPFSLRAAASGLWDLGGKTILNLGTFFGSGGSDTVTGQAVAEALVGEAGDDSIEGAGGNDAISGGAGNDTLQGGAGDDTLGGGDGLDALAGGDGDDRVDFLATGIGAGESFDGGAGFDTANFRDDSIVDIAALTLTSVEQLIFSVFATTTLTLAQFNQATTLNSLGTPFSLRAAGSGAWDLSGKTIVSLGTFFGASGNDTITGRAVTDILVGEAGNDRLVGADGNDSLSGGAGNDTLIGGIGDDTLAGGDGLDTLQGGNGDDRVDFLATGISAGESFDGGAGFDTANFRDDGIGNITALALTGVERLIFSVFTTTTLTLAQFNQATELNSLGTPFALRAAGAGTWDLGARTIVGLSSFAGSAGDDTVLGLAVADSLLGEAGNDSLLGAGGNDALQGGAGNDTLQGGLGDDTFSGGDGLDALQGGDGDDRVDFLATGVGAGESFDGGVGFDTANFRDDTITDITALALTGVEQLIFAFFATTTLTLAQFQQATTLTSLGTPFALRGAEGGLYDLGARTVVGLSGFTGSAGADTIRGTAAADSLSGAAGNDVIAGGGGGDSLDGGDGLDLLDYGASVAGVAVNLATGAFAGGDAAGDSAVAGSIEGVLGSAFADALTGDAGANTLSGGAGGDTLDGGAGADSLSGGGGADSLAGGAGNDTYAIDPVGDTVSELPGGGVDTIRVAGSFTLGAELETLVLLGNGAFNGTGNALANRLTGNGAANRLEGQDGADTLLGGAGADTLLGGAAADSLNGGAGADVFRLLGPTEFGDRIADFTTASDALEIAGTAFFPAGPLAASNLAFGTATAAGPQLVYDTGTGRLSLDQNGTAAGGLTTLLLLVGAPALAASDIIIIP